MWYIVHIPQALVFSLIYMHEPLGLWPLVVLWIFSIFLLTMTNVIKNVTTTETVNVMMKVVVNVIATTAPVDSELEFVMLLFSLLQKNSYILKDIYTM